MLFQLAGSHPSACFIIVANRIDLVSYPPSDEEISERLSLQMFERRYILVITSLQRERVNRIRPHILTFLADR